MGDGLKSDLVNDDLKCVGSEAMLIGHIIKRIGMIAEYEYCLSEEDFTETLYQQLWTFLKRYYHEYAGAEIDQKKVNALYVKMLMDDGFKFLTREYDKNPYKLIKDCGKMGGNVHRDNPAFCEVKKFTLLRRLEKAGYNVEDILKRDDFKILTVDDIKKIKYEQFDSIIKMSRLHVHEDFGKNIRKRAMRFLDEPEIGLQTPFEFINYHMHGLCKNDLTLIGGASNSGKGRFLMYLLVWLIGHEGQKICLMSNEMTQEDFFKAMVCTVVNMSSLHGKELRLTQTDIVQSQFMDAEGEYIERTEGERAEDYDRRLMEHSPDYREYVEILQWWEEHFEDRFIFVNVMDDYSPERLRMEVRQAKAQGCTVIAYDTLKSYQSSEWEDFVQAATDLSEMIKNDKDGLIGIATFQLTDDAAFIKPEDLSVQKIARAKGIYHVADSMMMFVHLKNGRNREYYLSTDENEIDLSEINNITAFRLVKNRRGNGKEQIFALQHDLDRNVWVQRGELIPKRLRHKAS